MNKVVKVSLSIAIGAFLLNACNKDEKTKEIEKDTFGFENPTHFPTALYNFEKNEINEPTFQLGKKLFFDPILSGNNTISCGTCHLPTNAFAQADHEVSHGVEDRLGRRNSPALYNVAWMSSFMHDGGVVDLDLQPIVPIQSHEEMDQNITELPAKLAAIPEYRQMFQKAFGSEEITSVKMLKSLSQFMVMLVSANGKYDSVKLGKTSFNELESIGYNTFLSKCNACHKEPLFTDHSFRNNGTNPSKFVDSGRFEITRLPNDLFAFKVPSLRNLKYSFPYMHDGSVRTLEDVLDFYTQPVDNIHGSVDPILLKESVAIPLTNDEKKALLAFLGTLNDPSFVKNPLFQE